MRYICLLLFGLLTCDSLYAQSTNAADREVYATLESDKTPVYVGEPFPLTLTIASKIDLDHSFTLKLMPDSGRLAMTKFEALDSTPPAQSDSGEHHIKRFRVHAQGDVAGPLNVRLSVDGTTIVRRQNAFGLSTFRRSITFPVDPLTLAIQSIPPPRKGYRHREQSVTTN